MTEPLFVSLHASLAHALPQWQHTWSPLRITQNYISLTNMPAMYRLLTCQHNYEFWATDLQLRAYKLPTSHEGVPVYRVHQIPDIMHKRYVVPVHIRKLYPITVTTPTPSFEPFRSGADKHVLGALLGTKVPSQTEAAALRTVVANVTDVYAAKVRMKRRPLVEEIANAFVSYEYGYSPVVVHQDAIDEAAATIAEANPVSIAHDILSAVQIQERVHEALDWHA